MNTDDPLQKRCFGWFDSFEKSEKAVLENRCDMHECFYNYIVIEKLYEGIHSLCHENDQVWYKWKSGNQKDDEFDESGKWERVEKPEQFKSMINFGIG